MLDPPPKKKSHPFTHSASPLLLTQTHRSTQEKKYFLKRTSRAFALLRIGNDYPQTLLLPLPPFPAPNLCHVPTKNTTTIGLGALWWNTMSQVTEVFILGDFHIVLISQNNGKDITDKSSHDIEVIQSQSMHSHANEGKGIIENTHWRCIHKPRTKVFDALNKETEETDR